MQRPLYLAVLLALSTSSGHATEVRSTLADQQNVAVTIYNSNMALIKEQRRIKLGRGVVDLALRDVSAQMRPETAILRNVSTPDAFEVLEQNFNFDLLTPLAMLQKYVGKSVGVVRTHPTTGAESVERADVLSAANGVVLRIGNRIETGVPGRLVYDSVPDNLRDRPTLVAHLDNAVAGEQTAELSYLTGGLDWKADYVAELDAKDQHLDLRGWVTLTNQSGATYTNAKLQLVAGDVHRVPQRTGRLDEGRAVSDILKAKKEDIFAEENFFEYHLYELNRPTTIADNQTKQVSLLSANNVAVSKELVVSGYEYFFSNYYPQWSGEYKVGVFVSFDNREKNNLGKPLPKGAVRVYKLDSSGRAQFIGEDNIDHTPKNETVKLKLGNAFDVTAERKQTEWRKADAGGKYSYASESAYEIKLKNAKKEPVVVTVKEPIPGDWEILRESQGHEKPEAHLAVWKVTVPAEGSSTLTYRALVRY